MKKKSVTIGIPAHNEAGNIGALIESLLKQSETGFDLNRIIVICDGCADRTAQIAKNYSRSDHRVEVIDDKKRLGKISRLNQLYSLNSSDILVTFDADSLPGGNKTIMHLVDSFTSPEIGLVGGHDSPFPPRSLFEKVVSTAIDLWYQTRLHINGGDSVHNHHGCITALSKSLADKMVIPAGVVSDDEFLYFQAKKLGYAFKFSPQARAHYRVPGNLQDYLIQTSKFLQTKDLIASHFGRQIYQEYNVPLKLKVMALLKTFIKEPLMLPLALGLQVLARFYKNQYHSHHRSSRWTMIQSTKI